MILSNQKRTYNKVLLRYQSDNNVKYFNKIFHAKRKISHNIFKCNYCSKNEHIAPYYFSEIHTLKWTYMSSFEFSKNNMSYC